MLAPPPELPFDKEKALWDEKKQLRDEKQLLREEKKQLEEKIVNAEERNEEPRQRWLDEKKELKEQINKVERDIKKVEQDIANYQGLCQRKLKNELQHACEMLDEAGLETFRTSHDTAFKNIMTAFNECSVVSDDRAQNTPSVGPAFKSTKTFFEEQMEMMQTTVKLPLFKEDVPHGMESSEFMIIDKGVEVHASDWNTKALFRMSAHLAFFLSGGWKGKTATTLRDSVPRRGNERKVHEAYCELFAFLEDTKYMECCVSTCNEKAGNDAPSESSSYFMPDRRPDLCLCMTHSVSGVVPLLPLEVKASTTKTETKLLNEARKELRDKVVGPVWIPMLFHGVKYVYGSIATLERFKGFCFFNGNKGVSSTEVCDFKPEDVTTFAHFRLKIVYAALTLATINAVSFVREKEKEINWNVNKWVVKSEPEYIYEGSRKKPITRTHFFLANREDVAMEDPAVCKVAIRIPGRKRNGKLPGNIAPWVEKAVLEDDANTPYARLSRVAWCKHLIRELAEDDERAKIAKLQYTAGAGSCKIRCLGPVGQHAGVALSGAAELATLAKHVLCGLQFLHAGRFVHRDVRLQNVISVADEKIPGVAKYVLIDLDSCSALDDGKAFATMPPESRTLDKRVVSKGYYPLPSNETLSKIQRSTVLWTCLCDINQLFWFILRSPVVQKQVFNAQVAETFATQVDQMQMELNTKYPGCDARNIYLSEHHEMQLVGPAESEFTSSCSCHASEGATKSLSQSVVKFLREGA